MDYILTCDYLKALLGLKCKSRKSANKKHKEIPSKEINHRKSIKSKEIICRNQTKSKEIPYWLLRKSEGLMPVSRRK